MASDRSRSAWSRLLVLLAGQDIDEAGETTVRDLFANSGDDVDWPAFVLNAERHRVAGLVAARLRDLRARGMRIPIDPAARRILDAIHIAQRASNDIMALEIEAIVDAACSADVPVMLRKGGHLAYSVYADPAQRAMNDLDLLAKPGHEQALVAVLRQLGYQEGEPAPDGTSIRPLDARKRIFWHLYGSDLPKLCKLTGRPARAVVHIDVNTSLMLPGKEYDLPVEGLFDRAVRVPFGNGEATVPSSEDALADLCLHLFKNSTALFFMHAGKHRRLIKYVDIAQLIRSSSARGSFGWPVFLERVREHGIARPVYFALKPVSELCPGTVDPEALAALAAEIQDADVFLDQYGQWDLAEPARWTDSWWDRMFEPARTGALPKARSLL